MNTTSEEDKAYQVLKDVFGEKTGTKTLAKMFRLINDGTLTFQISSKK